MTHLRGFSLIEFVAVLALTVGLVLSLMQLQQSLGKKQYLHEQIDAVVQIEADLYHYVGLHQELPQDVEQVWGPSLPEFPGIRSIEIVQGERPSVRLHFWRAQEATQIANKLYWVERVESSLQFALPALQQTDSTLRTEAFLHRFALAGEPELNQMETDLHMNNFDLKHVGALYAEQAVIDELVAEQVYAHELITEQLRVLEWLEADEVWAQSLDVNVLQAQQVESQSFYTEALQVQQLVGDNLTVLNLAAEQSNFTRVTAGEVETDWLVAHSVVASDILANGVSFNALHLRLQELESNWLLCVQGGGCR